VIQRDLFGKPPKRRPATLDERFLLWMGANEKMVELFLRFARDAKQSGAKHFGIGAIAERVRWEVFIERKEADPYKVNNDYRSRLARHLVKLDPSLEGLFEFRKLAAERKVKKASG
jgi:hypothetical protein